MQSKSQAEPAGPEHTVTVGFFAPVKLRESKRTPFKVEDETRLLGLFDCVFYIFYIPSGFSSD